MRYALASVTVLAALMLAGSSTAAHPRNCGHLQPRAELRCARAELRIARDALRHPALYPHHSRAYFRWRERVDLRWIRSARYRLSHPPIPHRDLWLCIHRGEGAWNDPDSGRNGHYGGLQMTSPWGRGDYYVYRADQLTPYEQMRKAELGYRASGYSRSWLYGQWAHPECMGYA